MTLVAGNSELIARAVAGWLEMPRDFGACQALGVVDDGELVGGFVFHNWQPETGCIEISMGGNPDRRPWFKRRHGRGALIYAFDTCDVKAVIGWSATTNADMRRLWLANGAVPHVITPLGMTMYVTARDDWRASRFYGGHYGEA